MPRRKQSLVFNIKCLKRYAISLSLQCWEGHILVYHPELWSRSEDVKETLVNPDKILEDKKHGRYSLLYYKAFKDKYNPCKFLKVAVCINKQKRTGIVASAYPVMDTFGGDEIWKK